MTGVASDLRGSAPWFARLAERPFLPVALLALVLMALDPVGYVGGGWDDWYYLDAARCWAEHGYCLPGDHWARRVTLVAPLAGSIALFGESRAVLWLVPAAYSLAALALLVAVVARPFGRPAALLAGLALLLTPAFGERMLHVGVDIPELAFALAAIACLQRAAQARSGLWAAAGGALLGLAILTRPTALAMLPLFVGAMLLVPSLRRGLLPFALGGLAPLLIEAGAFALMTGDPLRPWALSLAHGAIPSSELEPGVDLSRSPLFNIAFIDGWRPAAGIEVHWTIDAFLNLIAHPATGFTLLAAFALLLLNGRRLGRPEAGGRAIPLLILAAALYFGALVYALAVDPKPRMFLPVMAVAAAVIGVLAAEAWRNGQKLLPAALAILLAVNGTLGVVGQPDVKSIVRAAGALLRAPHGPLAVERSTRRLLALEPLAAALPEQRPGARIPVLILGRDDCGIAAARLDGRWRAARQIETGSRLAGDGRTLLCILAPVGDAPRQGEQLEGQE
ncbi:MAG TPA: glycosyltransferase family 39 protein [Allosphingosinicella sp.]|nr:glycosyltransferase family 39 protein [Allosphingosinicella sp.]